MSVSIEPMQARHWPQAEQIYVAGIATGQATFETAPPTWAAFAASRPAEHRHVAVDGATVHGWVAATPVSDRCAYAGVVEVSVYVDPGAQGRGLGRRLLDTLAESTERSGIWTIQAGVFPENRASIAAHRAAGYEVVGTRRRLGRMSYGPWQGLWRDVVLLERRSAVVGRD